MLKAKKSLSQNFLIDKNIAKKIVNLTDIKDKIIFEIGPGYGFMTDNILKKNPKKLYLIEKDSNLVKFLKQKYINIKNIIIIEDDILKYNIREKSKLIIISNLPYNISAKIILYLFNYNDHISEMIFMLQKEVADKFDYNRSNMNKYKFLTKIFSSFTQCFDVSSNVFSPKPKVKSTVVKFILREEKIEIRKVYNFTNLIFKNIRKKIYKNIKLKKSNNELLNKRVNELTIKQLLDIYNSI